MAVLDSGSRSGQNALPRSHRVTEKEERNELLLFLSFAPCLCVKPSF